ncbi:hypothetical protein Taro_013065 [Colocasia esculenta]|uniref:Homeobox domain-containing protein n=1 Tax=Colocasia esculenta TaxID=4460 RepID=A0A843UEU8_COLES|nr:hypothetical protein [Colocasia esculenta]
MRPVLVQLLIPSTRASRPKWDPLVGRAGCSLPSNLIIAAIMASSNRHWPSLFKAKPCNSHLQWQHDINSSSLLPNACQKASYSSGKHHVHQLTSFEKSEPEYGQVGDANVFYWFQNRKSRSKHKQRHLQSTRAQSRGNASSTSLVTAASVATSSSSSSSERSTGSEKTRPLSSLGTTGVGPAVVDVPISPVATASLSSFFQQTHGEFSDESLLLQQCPQEYCFSTTGFTSPVGVPADHNTLGLCNGLFTDQLSQERCKSDEEQARLKTNLHHSYAAAAATAATTPTTTTANTTTGDVATAATVCNTATTRSFGAITSTTADTIIDIIHALIEEGCGGDGGHFNVASHPRRDVCMAVRSPNGRDLRGARMGAGACGATRTTVFINGVAFEVGTGPLNVREAFRLIHVVLRDGNAPVMVASPLVVNG